VWRTACSFDSRTARFQRGQRNTLSPCRRAGHHQSKFGILLMECKWLCWSFWWSWYWWFSTTRWWPRWSRLSSAAGSHQQGHIIQILQKIQIVNPRWCWQLLIDCLIPWNWCLQGAVLEVDLLLCFLQVLYWPHYHNPEDSCKDSRSTRKRLLLTGKGLHSHKPRGDLEHMKESSCLWCSYHELLQPLQ